MMLQFCHSKSLSLLAREHRPFGMCGYKICARIHSHKHTHSLRHTHTHALCTHGSDRTYTRYRCYASFVNKEGTV